MKTKEQYGKIQPDTPEYPPRAIIRTPRVIVSQFGPSTFRKNLAAMQGKKFSCLHHYAEMTFREPTTRESVLAAGYRFVEISKPEIFDSSWLQAGRIARAREGVFINPPRDGQGNTVLDEKELNSLLGKTKSMRVGKGKIYIVSNKKNLRDFAFADYDSFQTGVQDSGTFAQGGIALVLEHTKRSPAPHLSSISSKKHYDSGVNVWGFNPVSEPIERVVSLGSGRLADGGRLLVDGGWIDGYGCVLGVSNSGEATQKI
ncbi:MAG: hypothetical protein ABIG28_03370 [archaeon]